MCLKSTERVIDMGAVLYDPTIDRPIVDGVEIHAGDCIEVLLDGKWTPVRIEYSDAIGWHMAGRADTPLLWLQARL